MREIPRFARNDMAEVLDVEVSNKNIYGLLPGKFEIFNSGDVIQHQESP